MKKIFTDVITVTGLVLIFRAVFAALFGYRFLLVDSVFSNLGAVFIICLGLRLTAKFESSYAILEAALDLTYINAVLILFGLGFNWFATTPFWLVAIIAILVYLTGLFLNTFRLRQEINTINDLLQKRQSAFHD